jgi:hypothetical protein
MTTEGEDIRWDGTKQSQNWPESNGGARQFYVERRACTIRAVQWRNTDVINAVGVIFPPATARAGTAQTRHHPYLDGQRITTPRMFSRGTAP